MTSVDAACDLNTRLKTVLSTSLLIKALLFCLIYKSASWTRELPVCSCLGGGGRGPSTKTPLCVASAGSLGGERALGRVGVEGKTKRTKTQNKNTE